MTDQIETQAPGTALRRTANRPFVLVLQHPREQREALNTGRLVLETLENAVLKVGLSWPSLRHVLGRNADPRRWATLYLGAAKDFPGRATPPLALLDREGNLLDGSDRVLPSLEGLIALDGTWSQAKTLWWRNPWLLKSWRLVLNPDRRSLYGRLRREPRREGLSTLEAVAFCLAQVNRDPSLYDRLVAPLEEMLRSYGSPTAAIAPTTPEPGEESAA